MTDPTCDECERLWQAHEQATQALRLIEHRFAMETGLEKILRKASNRCQQAGKALQDHEATHMPVTVVASASG
jgi:hypothetical protein